MGKIRSTRNRVRSGVLALVAALAAFGIGAIPAIAGTGTVYYDNNANTGAGRYMFLAGPTGVSNVGLGYTVMNNLTTGDANTETGHGALYGVTTGSDNTAFGYQPLNHTTTGGANTGVGFRALHDNSVGWFNVAAGIEALQHTTGDRNVALGSDAGVNLTRGDYNVDVANRGVAGESGTIRIGTAGQQTRAFLAGVYGNPVQRARSVVINSNGRLGTTLTAASAQSHSLSRLRAENRRQSEQLHQLRAAVQRLREEVRKGG